MICNSVCDINEMCTRRQDDGCRYIRTTHEKGLESHFLSIDYQIDSPDINDMNVEFRPVCMFEMINVEAKKRMFIEVMCNPKLLKR